LGLAKVKIVKTFGKIHRYTLCSGVAAAINMGKLKCVRNNIFRT